MRQILLIIIAHFIVVSMSFAEEIFLTPNYELVAPSKGVFILCVQRIPETRKTLGEWIPMMTCEVASPGRISWFLTHSKIQGDAIKLDMYVRHEKNQFSAIHYTHKISQFIDETNQTANISLFESNKEGKLLIRKLSRHQGWSSTSEIKGLFFEKIEDAKKYLNRPELGVEDQFLPVGVVGKDTESN